MKFYLLVIVALFASAYLADAEKLKRKKGGVRGNFFWKVSYIPYLDSFRKCLNGTVVLQKAKLNDDCWWDFQCSDGLECEYHFSTSLYGRSYHKCKGKVGGSCSTWADCKKMSICYEGTCMALGGTCSKFSDCTSYRCKDGKCMDRVATGGVCSKGFNCASLYCKDGKCVDKVFYGSTCDLNDDCFYGSCQNGVCN